MRKDQRVVSSSCLLVYSFLDHKKCSLDIYKSQLLLLLLLFFFFGNSRISYNGRLGAYKRVDRSSLISRRWDMGRGYLSIKRADGCI